MENGIPNFDGMNRDELMAFWKRYARPSRKDAEALIGDRRRGYTSLCGTLAAYACAKASATGLREKGEIARAERYEEHCETYYRSLPADLRW